MDVSLLTYANEQADKQTERQKKDQLTDMVITILQTPTSGEVITSLTALGTVLERALTQSLRGYYTVYLVNILYITQSG